MVLCDKILKFKIILLSIFILNNIHVVFAQIIPNHLVFKIQELPKNTVYLKQVRGGNINIIDSMNAKQGLVNFKLSNKKFGVYQLDMGQATMAKVMNEPPQQLTFIYNHENVSIETSFKSPGESVKVRSSEENKVWFDFHSTEQEYLTQLKELEMQINYFQKNTNDKYYTASKRDEIIRMYNQIQKEQSERIDQINKVYPKLFATKLINSKREVFIDGNLNESERNKIKKEHFFDFVDFSDESLMNSSVYTTKAFQYIMLHAKRGMSRGEQEDEFKKSINVILSESDKNPTISAFIVNYLMDGFERLKLYNLQQYIADNYKIPQGCKDDNSTLERRLAFQLMKKGRIVPNFEIKDVESEWVKSDSISNDYKLILFWATWCPHCKEMIPQLKSWYLYKNIDLEIIAICIDTEVGEWNRFVTVRNLPWINCIEPHKWDGEVATLYNLYATPTMFLLDKENRILAKPIDFNEFMEATIDLK